MNASGSDRNDLDILDFMPEGAFVLDEEFCVVFWNQCLEQWTGIQRETILGTDIGITFNHFSEQKYRNRINYVFRTGSSVVFSFQLHSSLIPCQLPDGRERIQNTRITPIPNGKEKGRFHALVTIQDVTDLNQSIQKYKLARKHLNDEIQERKRMEERMRQTEKMQALGQLAGGVAHDFNNQLGGIIGYTEMLERKLHGDIKLTRYTGMILKASRRAADLTRQLLAFARKGKYQSKPVNLHELVFEIVSLLEHSIDKRIRIDQQLEANYCITVGDPTQLQSALLNICLNARDAMPHGGVLSFTTMNVTLDATFCKNCDGDPKPGPYIRLDITDTGIGMNTEIQAHVFEPFFTTKDVGQGTGLGLAGTYGCIQNHNGTIKLQSKPGEGSTFSVYLPMHGVPETPIPADKPNNRQVGSGHVLVIDDEEVVRLLACDMLEDLGYTTHACSDGDEAVEYFSMNADKVDLVLADMIMPHLSGPDTYHALKNIRNDVKLILVSGHTFSDAAQKTIDAGALGFINKPYEMSTFSKIVANSIQHGKF